MQSQGRESQPIQLQQPPPKRQQILRATERRIYTLSDLPPQQQLVPPLEQLHIHNHEDQRV